MKVSPGSASSLGATWDAEGVNVAIYSAHATSVVVCLFDSAGAMAESARVPLPRRTGDVWHGYLHGVRAGQWYGLRVDGPWDPASGHRFNANKVVLDPYARLIGRPARIRPALFAALSGTEGEGPMDQSDSAADAPLAVVSNDWFEWHGDRPPDVPWRDTVIYELHVKGFSVLDHRLPRDRRGTYLGLASDASTRYLRDLGVTAVELMPVHAHTDEWGLGGRGLTNYWGYNTLAFFAPDDRFASSHLDAVHEFKTMVRALHAANLEVILDVVYNHTAEGDHPGPTLSLRGLDNASYYRLDAERRSRYEDLTGCGNTLDVRAPVVRRLILDSLRYWVHEMHVDGFRFDLAAALTPEDTGPPSIFDDIAQDSTLSRVKLIVEPWDARGRSRLGRFPQGIGEWNGRYRDTVRRFWRGDAGMLPELATRLAGSSDLFEHDGRRPVESVNYVTSHDGFTLADLVSYAEKHNAANGEGNRDGDSHRDSWNGGVEGPATDAQLAELRRRERRSLLLTLFVSLGVPMVSGGDEVERTQRGNNNAYCQDSELSWTPRDVGPDAEAFRGFLARLIALRASQPVLRRVAFLRGRLAGSDEADLVWLRPDGQEMTGDDWADGTRRALGLLLVAQPLATEPRDPPGPGDTLLVLMNAAAESADFVLPARGGLAWSRVIDTAEPDGATDLAAGGSRVRLQEKSAAVFRNVP